MTLREITLFYDLHLLESWDHTSHIICMIYNLVAVTVSLNSKSRMKTKPAIDFHPYRKKPRRGLKITAENIDVLHTIGNIVLTRGSR